MSFLELLRVSFYTIKANKLRTILAMIGIVIGTMTIALVTAIWWGVEQAVEDLFKTVSVNTLFVFPDSSEESEMNTDDVDILLRSTYVTRASASISRVYNVSNSLNTTIEKYSVDWIKENYFDQYNLEIDVWKLFLDGDAVDKVAVIWVNIAKDLLEVEDPREALGQTVTVKSKKFRVIGVLKEVWVSFAFDYDDTIYLPIWTTKRYLIKGDLYPVLSLVVDDVENIEAAKEEITDLLRDEYKVKKGENEGFEIIDAGATIDLATDIANILSLLLLGISVIILIVSGIWIMNVMFAWVAERTKEIGILKSLWATQSEIKNQFLLESIIITVLSWLVWVLLAELILTVAIYFEAPISRSFRWDVLSLWFAVVTWVFSWRYPAARAAKMDPVDALRG